MIPIDTKAARARIDDALSEFVGSLDAPEPLQDAISYALLGGGKRIRPLLAWRACEAMGGRGASALPACVAVELVHAFSLVHDDLPALDNDDLRRGRPTLHRHAGEAMAILAGDAMLALSTRSLVAGPLPGALSASLVRELVAGTMGMIAGQVGDTLGALGAPVRGVDAVEWIHERKTGALIIASVRMGAMLAATDGVDVRELDVNALGSFARDIGLLFQITDDLIDVQQAAAHAGKATGKDAAAGKLTFPGVLGIEASRARADDLAAGALRALESFGAAADGLREIARGVAERTR